MLYYANIVEMHEQGGSALNPSVDMILISPPKLVNISPSQNLSADKSCLFSSTVCIITYCHAKESLHTNHTKELKGLGFCTR